MKKPDYHLLLCGSFRNSGKPQGICHRRANDGLLQYLESEVSDRGLDAIVSVTGCLKVCEKGPVMVVYPQGEWYGEVDEDRIDSILDALEDGDSLAGLC